MKNAYKVQIFNSDGDLIQEITSDDNLFKLIDNYLNKRVVKRAFKFRLVGLNNVDESIVFNSNAEAELITGINHRYFTPYKIKV